MPCEFHTYCIWRIKSYRNQNKTSGRGQDSCDSLSLLGTKPVWFCIPQALFSRSDGFCDASKAQLEGDYFALHWPLIGWTTWSLHSLSSTLVCLCKRQGKGHGRQKKKKSFCLRDKEHMEDGGGNALSPNAETDKRVEKSHWYLKIFDKKKGCFKILWVKRWRVFGQLSGQYHLTSDNVVSSWKICPSPSTWRTHILQAKSTVLAENRSRVKQQWRFLCDPHHTCWKESSYRGRKRKHTHLFDWNLLKLSEWVVRAVYLVLG